MLAHKGLAGKECVDKAEREIKKGWGEKPEYIKFMYEAVIWSQPNLF